MVSWHFAFGDIGLGNRTTLMTRTWSRRITAFLAVIGIAGALGIFAQMSRTDTQGYVPRSAVVGCHPAPHYDMFLAGRISLQEMTPAVRQEVLVYCQRRAQSTPQRSRER